MSTFGTSFFLALYSITNWIWGINDIAAVCILTAVSISLEWALMEFWEKKKKEDKDKDKEKGGKGKRNMKTEAL